MNGKRFIADVKGVGIKAIAREYYMSTSSTEQAGGSWSTSIPTLGDNKYLWYRDVFTMTDGKIATTTPICDGVWEEIYQIYDINEKVSGYATDVETLKTDMATVKTALEKGIVRINQQDVTADTFNVWSSLGNDGDCYLKFSSTASYVFAVPKIRIQGTYISAQDDTTGVLVSLRGYSVILPGYPAIYQTFYSRTGIWYRTITKDSVGEWGQGDWVSLTPWAKKGTWDTLRYKQFGNKITIEGYATKLAWDGTTGDIITSLPFTMLAPKSTHLFYATTSGARMVRMYVDTDGDIGIDWNRKLSDGSGDTSEMWYKFFCEYYI